MKENFTSRESSHINNIALKKLCLLKYFLKVYFQMAKDPQSHLGYCGIQVNISI